jgi:hypothetical protein
METVAVLVIVVSAAASATVPVMVSVMTPLGATLPVRLTLLPLPEAVPQLEPEVAVQVQLTPVRLLGTVSVMVTPFILAVPLFDTVTW